MKKILLHGAFYGSNYGDVLFCEIFSKVISLNHTVLYGSTGKYIKKRLKLQNLSSEFIDFFRSDAVVFAPGGYFGEPNSTGLALNVWRIRMFFRHAYLGVICRALKKPYAIIGLGVGPINFSFGKKIIRYIFEGSRMTTVRDNESLLYLESMGVNTNDIEVTVDSIFGLKDELIDNKGIEYIRSLSINGKILVLHVSSGGDNAMQIVKAVNRFLILHKDYTLVVCTDFMVTKMNPFLSRIFKELEGTNYKVLDYKPENLTALLNYSTIVITSKLHVGIVAASFKKSVVSFPVHNKTKRFYDQINQSDRCLEMKLVTEDIALDMLEEFENKRIDFDVELVHKSKLNFKKLNDFLESLE